MMFEIAIQDSDARKLTPHLEVPLYELGQKMSICFHVSSRITLLSSMDSDLEAFSHDPPDSKFAALIVQLTALLSSLNTQFLSYSV